MNRLLKINDYIEVHLSKKAFIYCPTLHVGVDSHDGYDTIHQIYLGKEIIMQLMHGWWSAFILIACKAAYRTSGGDWTARSLRSYTVWSHWKSLATAKCSLFSQGWDTSLHLPTKTITVSPPRRHLAHCKVNLVWLMVTNTPVEGS